MKGRNQMEVIGVDGRIILLHVHLFLCKDFEAINEITAVAKKRRNKHAFTTIDLLFETML
jgi:hypothetical protein